MYISNTKLKVKQSFRCLRHYAINVYDGMGLPTGNEAPVAIYSYTKLHQNLFLFVSELKYSDDESLPPHFAFVLCTLQKKLEDTL
jgi:hypothetical protein